MLDDIDGVHCFDHVGDEAKLLQSISVLRWFDTVIIYADVRSMLMISLHSKAERRKALLVQMGMIC